MPTRALCQWLLAVAMLAACPERSQPYDPPDGDADVDADTDADVDATGDGDVEAGADAEADGGDAGPADPGPLTFVVAETTLTADRLCDLDGNGSLDNAIADLGSPASDMLLMALQSFFDGVRSEETERALFHVPFVDDRTTVTDPEALIITAKALDSDDPPDLTDDLDGDESFWIRAESLDACGEPLFHCAPVSLDGGDLRGECGRGLYPNQAGIPLRGGSFEGVVTPPGAALDARFCGLMLVSELGPASTFETVGDLTLLELLLAGGAPMGLSAIPGIAPDLDLDGDGLESVVLDADFHIAYCIDGDLTRIDGRDCWADPRIADGFATTFRVTGVPATFLGREPGWQELVAGTCPEPPDRSLFDPI